MSGVATELEEVSRPEQGEAFRASGFICSGNTAWLKALGATFALTALTLAVFEVFPRLDLAVDNQFSSSKNPFPAQDMAILHFLRVLMSAMTDGVMAVTLMWMLIGYIFPVFRIVRQRVLGFMILSYVTVPGLLVNLGLKHHWGRARPRDIVEFVGTARFTPPLQPADQCSGGCSFVSAEASALFTVATLLVLFFVPLLGPRWRAVAVASIGAIAVFGSGLRVALGAHFASDVILAALISVVATLISYRVTGMNGLSGPLAADGRRVHSAQAA